jgi:DNA mismatch repair protein MutS
LFFRLGDFYELFFEDALKAAPALDIALTRRGRQGDDDIPMCGVPVHSAESYLERLIRKGFKVAICEQTEDPAEARRRGYDVRDVDVSEFAKAEGGLTCMSLIVKQKPVASSQ